MEEIGEKKAVCPNCGGSGKSDDGPCSPPGVCSLCDGTGRVPAKE